MATYKKRGYKPKTKAEKEVVLEDDSTTAEVFNTLDEGASRTEAFVEKNQNVILGIVGAIALCVLGYLAYEHFIQEPKEQEALVEMNKAQTYFDQAVNGTASDSLYNLALEGGEGKYGFLDIIDNYGGTKAGNLAEYYAGMAYLNTNNYQEAINHLDNFSSDDEMLAPLAKGAIGDAFVQLNQEGEALGYYEEAAAMRSNSFTRPRFLLKAGITALNLGQSDKASTHFDAITNEFPDAPEAAKAKLYASRAASMK